MGWDTYAQQHKCLMVQIIFQPFELRFLFIFIHFHWGGRHEPQTPVLKIAGNVITTLNCKTKGDYLKMLYLEKKMTLNKLYFKRVWFKIPLPNTPQTKISYINSSLVKIMLKLNFVP